MVKIILPLSKKRHEPPEILEGQDQKKQKMDCGFKMECRKILRALMTHKSGPIFNEPVDPDKLGIPDYFSIISHPMDLGTVNKKLEADTYFSAEAFAADIRLTFANAMQYNPPQNIVHSMAKNMNSVFDKHWVSVAAKIKTSKKVTQLGASVNGKPKITQGANKSLLTLPPKSLKENTLKKVSAKNSDDTSKALNTVPAKTSRSSKGKTVRKQSLKVTVRMEKSEDTNKACHSLLAKILPCSEEKHPLTSDEKATLKKELLEALRGELTGPLRGFLRKYGLINSKKEKIESVFGCFGDDALCELKRAVKGSLATNTVKGKNDHIKTQLEKEISQCQRREDKLDIEARIKAARAAKEAILVSAKSDLQMKREKERERVEKMSRTVLMDDNLTCLRELEKLCQCPLVFDGHERKSPLEERFGLRLKDEYLYGYEYDGDGDGDDEDADAILLDELEDGEIV